MYKSILLIGLIFSLKCSLTFAYEDKIERVGYSQSKIR
ncbi:hypothetical protein GPLA_2130 [Paraglaciecola polaris LMG 21857]|uniref:Uncharacterized protein n=1 Tax=Paraglaciecola polaris LMG 21857 TaxID=1129793 RepID=K7ACF3_9ALTE|nr:hypothetical protein GPLA_2130 [Paraglaciecola polaris LMG 21857]